MANRKLDLENRAGLSEELIDLLAADFKKLKKIDPDLPERVLRYVVDGEGDSLLKDIEKNEDFALTIELVRGLLLGGSKSGAKESPRKLFFQNPEIQNPELLLRLAKVYQAAISNYYAASGSDRSPAWLDTFLIQATQFTMYEYPQKWNVPGVKAETVGKMLTLDGFSPSALVEEVFLQDAGWFADNPKRNIYTTLPGYSALITSYPESVVESLTSKRVQQRVYALKLLTEIGASVEPFVEIIAKLVLSNSTDVRHSATQVIERQPDLFVPHILSLLNTGTPDERANAVSVIAGLNGNEAEQILEDRLKKEKSQKVIEQINKCLNNGENNAAVSSVTNVPSSAVAIESVAPLSPDSLEYLKKVLKTRYQKKAPIDILCDIIQGTSPDSNDYKTYEKNAISEHYGRVSSKYSIDAFLKLPDVQLIHVVRLQFLMNQMNFGRMDGMWVSHYANQHLKQYRKLHPEIGLREVAEAIKLLGIPDDEVGWERIQWYGQSMVWEDEATWPYFAQNLNILEEALGLRPLQRKMQSYEKPGIRKNALEVLTSFPTLPEPFIPFLWDIALGSAKTEKPIAMQCLSKLPDTKEKLIQALKSSKQDARASAAEWLAQMGVKEAVPDIEAALLKEKSEAARTAMMTALESFGIPLEKYLDLKGLAAEAEAGLKKGIPESLSWFKFDALPAVHWQESGKEVPREVVKWWIVHNNKLNNPEPGPLLRRYFSMIAAEDREALGMFILNSWIGQDTIPVYSYDDALKEAKKQAKQSLQFYQQYMPGTYTLERLEKQYLNTLLCECKGSAIKEKGILALTAASGGSKITPVVDAYLKKWYGQRAAQCRALVRILSWIEDNSAIQLLLATSVRFRTKSIREEAETCVKALAERKGWTVEELADRTIPTVGFDEGPEMALDYGLRSFTAQFDQSFNIILKNEDGEVIKSLPDPRKDDDEEKVKESKWRLSNAKKELKTVLKAQKERLYEAMCTQRTWKFDDWNMYLNNHPLVRYYCQGLVWTASEDGKADITFRPLDDGTFTDHQDSDVVIPPDATVRLAHTCTVSEETNKAWQQHIKDYEVTSAFEQFSRQAYVLPDEKRDETQLTDYEGYIIDSFKLRSAVTKLGYTREKSEEGGWFYEYSRSFSGLGLDAVISFTGSELPETSRPVALTALYFRKRSNAEREMDESGPEISLGEVPPVLLTECWNDIRLVAAQGSGYDKDWEKLAE